MSNEYLRKTVGDRRTGANLIGIHVDTSNMNNIAPDFSMAFKQLEAFAKETDDLKIQNEKKRLQLQIAENRITFKEKYLNDPSVYASQEKWDEVNVLYNSELANAKQMIADSKYLSKDEKMLYAKSLDVDFKESWIEPRIRRNGVVSKERVEEATALLDTAINNASLDDLYKTNTIENFIKTADEIYEPLIRLGIATQGDKNKKIIQGMATIEGTRLDRKAGSEILYNPMLSYEQKKEEINKAISTLNSEERINQIAESMSNEYGYDNYEKEYLKSSLKMQYQKAGDELNKKLYSLNLQDKTQKQLEALQKKQNNKDNEIIKAIEANDFFKYIKATTGIDLTTEENLDLKNSVNMNNAYGYTLSTFADPDNAICGQVISDVGMKEIKDSIGGIKRDDTEKITTQAIVENAINPYMSKIARKEEDVIAMLKDIGSRDDFKGVLNATVLIKGKENPLYYSTWDTLKEDESDKVQFVGGIFSGKGRQRFERLLNSENYVNTPQSVEYLTAYLSGLVAQSTDPKIQAIRKENYNTAIYKILNDNETFNHIERDILPILYNVKVSPINYRQAPLLPYERQANNVNDKVEEEDEGNPRYTA